MKYFEFKNKQTTITAPSEDGKSIVNWTFADLVIACLNFPGAAGKFSLEEQRDRLPIIGKFKAIKSNPEGEVKLHDSEFRKIERCAKAMENEWKFMHDDIVAFYDHLDILAKAGKETPEEATNEAELTT